MKHSLLTQQGVGLLASSEARFETKALPLLKADNVLTDGIADIVSLKKAWLVCRGEVDREASTAAGRLHFVEIHFPLNTSENRGSQRRGCRHMVSLFQETCFSMRT